MIDEVTPGYNQKQILTPNDIAKETGLAVNTIYSFLAKRELRSVKLGRKILISRANWERYLNGIN